jgi:hypothetical protein
MQQPFQQHQAAFNAYLRNPAQQKKPHGIAAKRIGIYREIVFNNFAASVSACFPVLLSILGKRRFVQLLRLFFSSHHFGNPLFSAIPKAFADFLQGLDLAEHGLPPYSAQLAHYEWIELYISRLAVEAVSTTSTATRIEHASDLADTVLQLPSAHMLLAYDFPVHLLSKKHANLANSPTYLLVFRTPDFRIEFMQLNTISYALLNRIQSEPLPVTTHLMQLAKTKLPDLPQQSVHEFGLQALHMLHLQQAVVVIESA